MPCTISRANNPGPSRALFLPSLLPGSCPFSGAGSLPKLAQVVSPFRAGSAGLSRFSWFWSISGHCSSFSLWHFVLRRRACPSGCTSLRSCFSSWLQQQSLSACCRRRLVRMSPPPNKALHWPIAALDFSRFLGA